MNISDQAKLFLHKRNDKTNDAHDIYDFFLLFCIDYFFQKIAEHEIIGPSAENILP